MFAKLLPFVLKLVPKLLELLQRKTGIQPKVGAAGLAGIVVYLLVVLLPMLGSPPIDEATAAAFAVIATFIAGWVKKNEAPE